MKRWISVCLLLTTILTACTPVKQNVTLDRSESYYCDFDVIDQEVSLSYFLKLDNKGDHEKQVRITISLPEDFENGLLKNEHLSSEIIVQPGSSVYKVYFIGEFAGNYQKQNRLLPEQIEIMEIT